MDNIVVYIVLFIILLIFSAFASSSEVALVALNRAKVNALAETGKRGKILEKLKDKPNRFLITILIVNNIVNTAAAAIATALALAFFGDAGVAIATGVVTVFVLIFGEIWPKTYANKHPDKVSLLVSPIIYALTWILSPFFAIAEKIKGTDDESEQPSVTEDEIREWIDVGEMEGAIEEDEKEMLYSVLKFDDITAKEIMTPRPDVIMIEDIASLDEAVAQIRDTGYSRLPVYHDVPDNIVGTINFKDVFNAYTGKNSSSLTVKSVMVDVYCVPESKKIDDLLRELQVRRLHMAIVLDEFGGFSGVVTFEDIMEELVGDIMDETDVDEVSDVIEINPRMYIIDAQVRVGQLNERFEIELPEDSSNYETIGGLVFSRLGRIPRIGESITLEDGISISVTKMRNRQILAVKMILPELVGKQETEE
ncbi:MAG TPA: hemolysin family protein [Methanocorpusculum sp.]|nr:hemolysin family protein [Methanocorpusculum sp.]HJJ40391.1 hemolysin family protein [Methanocorpusculum sp.]HJJ49686.1 hemolysin family protein [Methanocorpusculum sp.]HJJ57624.1 hemolysin family protein [Methanocorpusculum sp.]